MDITTYIRRIGKPVRRWWRHRSVRLVLVFLFAVVCGAVLKLWALRNITIGYDDYTVIPDSEIRL